MAAVGSQVVCFGTGISIGDDWFQQFIERCRSLVAQRKTVTITLTLVNGHPNIAIDEV